MGEPGQDGSSSSGNHPTSALSGGTSAKPTPANNVGGGAGWGDKGFVKGGSDATPHEGLGHVAVCVDHSLTHIKRLCIDRLTNTCPILAAGFRRTTLVPVSETSSVSRSRRPAMPGYVAWVGVGEACIWRRKFVSDGWFAWMMSLMRIACRVHGQGR
jgi:hypothetical protein